MNYSDRMEKRKTKGIEKGEQTVRGPKFLYFIPTSSTYVDPEPFKEIPAALITANVTPKPTATINTIPAAI